jgi:hypothetical protein
MIHILSWLLGTGYKPTAPSEVGQCLRHGPSKSVPGITFLACIRGRGVCQIRISAGTRTSIILSEVFRSSISPDPPRFLASGH